MVLQADVTGDELAKRILTLAADGDRRLRMARAARGMAKPDAAKVIADRALMLMGL